ncbi:multidrug resistance protein homolog 65 [Drosophila persimilis]|uniref:multidrug resistance protein homolog 65 n=1 Tax=Drosophila persimilis TaxID=7234 RepID=UPI000F0946A6|nr:multidrug resistance protein homolog 65 [Drosophila persimilis]
MDEASGTTTTDGKSLDEAPVAAGLEPTQPIGFLQLFRFSTCGEIAWLFFGFLMCCVKALTLPAVVIIYSEFTSMLVDRAMEFGTSSKVHALPLFGGGKSLTNATLAVRNEALYDDSISYGLLLTIASVVMFIAGIFSVDIFNVVALRQVSRMRIMLFTSVMRQEIGWHDLASKQNFVQSMVDDVEKIRDGISEKVGHFVYLIVGFIITVAISFSYGWKLTLAVSSYIPIVILVNYYVAKFQGKLTAREQESYAGAGNLAEEILSAIRTVVSFGGEKAEVQRYENFLVPARKASQWKGAFSGLSEALLKSMLYLSCAGAFWYGVNLIIDDRGVEDKEYTPAILMIAFFGIIVGADNIARTAPFLESFATARGCATNLFKVIDLQSKIDPLSTDGKLLNYGLRGDVEFQDVFFRYPSRPEVTVHRGLNIRIRAGQTVALVGSSGCGKSTCVQLLQRFYDPVFGSVMLDDLDIRKYNIQWLRSNIAVVGQEPVLFLGTIAQNISYGKPGATQKEIEAAATQAGAHEFITGLPESYRTMIGERGSQLSGGQKQRIAIARALIQNPKILLLDEATSALDYQSEKQVQQALDLASKGRTTIVVSHRLSAIRGADKIVFIQDGKVLEEGSHDDLMALESAYYRMVRAGDIHMPDELQTEDEETTIDDAKRKSLALLEKSFETSPLNFEKGAHKENSVQFDEPIVKPLPKDSNALKLQDAATAAEKPNFFHTFARIVRLSRPEWCYLVLGTISAIAVGCLYPAFSIIFGEFYAALAEQDPEDALSRTAVLSWACLGLAFVTGLVCFLQTYLFNYAGIWLTTRMRAMTFKAMVSQEVGWFDDEDNSVGALSARLSGEAAGVQGAIGYPLSGMIQALSNFTSSVTVAMYYNWKLALLCLANCPIIVGSVILEAKMMSTAIVREKQVIEEACRIATESITNIRTVAGLRREADVIRQYTQEIHRVEGLIHQKLRWRGVLNSTMQASAFFAYAVALCYGGVLVSEGQLPFQDIIKVSETLLYGSMMLAQSLAFTPAFSAALVAGHRLFQILDRRPRIVSPMGTIRNTLAKQLNLFEGVRYRGIEFRYPTRPDAKILQGLDLEVLKGQTVALVGHSGCGKSTCVQLLQRYYDPDEGSIHIDHDDIQHDLTLEGVRSRLGIVSQEPTLFERSIAENIAYGDNRRSVSMAEVMAAAKSANAHSFIISLPNGYDTRMGARGTQLSGGQKQRIAIARALVRNPKILLLDEATSALDLQSEQLVQQALDSACSGRTCIVIAHRLSTVQNADCICVVQNGRVVEQGTHLELISQRGIYAKLHKTQKDH